MDEERGLAVREAGSDLVAKTERQEPLLYYGGSGSNGDKTAIEYISDMHLLHHVRYYGDDLGEFVDALDQDGKERRVTVLALRKLVATQGDGRWLTKSLDETESAFKGRYQPKAWRGALPSLRLRDLSAGE